jgi:hypothetical protein
MNTNEAFETYWAQQRKEFFGSLVPMAALISLGLVLVIGGLLGKVL